MLAVGEYVDEENAQNIESLETEMLLAQMKAKNDELIGATNIVAYAIAGVCLMACCCIGGIGFYFFFEYKKKEFEL